MPAAPSAPPPVAEPKSTAPAPAPKVAPAPKPELSAPAEPTDAFGDAFADIDSIETGKPKAQPKKEVKRPEQKSEELEGKAGAVEDAEDEAQNPKSAKPKDDAEIDAELKSFKLPKELTAAYKALKQKVKEEYEPKLKKLTDYEARIKQYETKNPEAEKAVREKVSAIEKRNAELESHIKFVDYQKSSDYQEKYWQPYVQAWENANRELKGLRFTVEDPKGGEPVTRDVTQADLQYFANLDAAARRSEINRLFPEDKEEVKRHINTISHLFEESQKALEKAKTDAETHATTQKQQQEEFQKNRERFWRESNEFYANKYPQWFSKTEGDEEGNTIFDRGAALADLVFFPQDLTDDKIALLPKSIQESIHSKKPFTPDQLTKLHSITRNKAANHDRMVHQNKSLKARVAELEKSLKEFEESSPDNVRAGVINGIKSDGMDVNAELDALDRKGR